MKTSVFKLTLVLSLAILSGCTSFDKVAAEKRLAAANIDKLPTPDTSLAKPVKLGILLDLETVDSHGMSHRELTWADYEKNMVASYANSLVKEGAVSDYFFIPEQNEPAQDLNAVMNKAVDNKADALLTIRGVMNVDKYINPIGILDLTIIGAFLLPGSNMDVNLLVHLDLWDLKTKKPLISLKSDRLQRSVNTTFFIRTDSANTENAVSDVKIETLRPLLIDFKKKFAGIRFLSAAPPYPKNEMPAGQSDGK